MISKLQNPFVGAILGLGLSIAIGVGLCWRAALPLLQQAALARIKKPEVPELKQKGWDFWTIEIDNLSNELKGERARLRQQSELLDRRADRLAAEEKEFAKVRAEIDSLRREIAGKVIEITADESKNLRALAQTYSTLTPRAVVAIFKEMDDATAVKILSLMKADVIGPIFEEMSRTADSEGTPLARRAALLSERLRLIKSGKPATPS